MTIYDYIVIGVYLVFMLSLGPIYKSFSKTASDFFRGGGGMLWWVVGCSAFMTNFSAWSFTGGAAKAYETGTFFLVLFGANVVGLVFCYFFTAAKFRQMRIVTAVEGVRKRYGKVSEQVFTWLPLLFQVFFGGIMLYTVGVFMTGVFDVNITMIILILGIVMIGMTLVGGSWAATAGDFVQMLVILAITAIMAVLTLQHEGIGGMSGLIEKLPEKHFKWTEFSNPGIIIFFVITLVINQTIAGNSLLSAGARYVFVKDGRDARKAVIVSILGFVFLAPVWMIPALGAAVLFPDLGESYSQLNNPNEAAYVAIAIELLPKGLLGLLVCGIFAASLTTMNSLLNVYSGTFVRNFYIQIVNPEASEKKQIMVGRIFILLYGISWIMVAMVFKDIKSLQLFDLILLAAASLGLPAAIPLTYGLFIRKTPEWTGWSTMLVGFAVSIAARFIFTPEFLQNMWEIKIPLILQSIWGTEVPSFLQNVWTYGRPLNIRELGDLNIGLTTGVIFMACNVWFLLSMLFYKKSSQEYKQRVNDFFLEMHTPIEEENECEGDRKQYKVLSHLCIAYGGLTLLLLAVPNALFDRFLIFCCGGFIVAIGIGLRFIGRRFKQNLDTAAKTGAVESKEVREDPPR